MKRSNRFIEGGKAVDTGVADQQPSQLTKPELYVALGKCARLQGQTGSLMRSLVEELRDRGVKLHKRQEISEARKFILQGYPEGDVTRYTTNLRNLLTMPPKVFAEHAAQSESLSITWLPTQQSWYNVGDEVDILWVAKEPEEEQWWHCVVVGVCDQCRTGSKPWWVHWVGYKASDGRVPNPQLVSKHRLRVHDPSASAGTDTLYSVEYIRSNCLKASPEPAEEEVPELAVEAERSGKDAAEANADAEAKGKAEATALAEARAKKKKKAIAKAKATAAKDKANAAAKAKPVADAAEESRVEIIAVPSVFDWLSPFLNSDKIEVDLLLLESRPQLNSDDGFFGHYLALLKRLRFGQGVMYSAATRFQQYYEQQASALAIYPKGPVAYDAGKKLSFIQSMDRNLKANYLNAFSRNELVVICCLLAYPGLTFTNIDQKTRVTQKSSMIRGMSFVPEALEKYFHRRLRFLKVIDDVNHPRYMEPLSTVVLNSTYCYKQLVTCGYGADWTSVAAQPIRLEGFHEFLSVNGVYVRVNDEQSGREGRIVYAQVMSKRAASSLGIHEGFDAPHKDYARVLELVPAASSGGFSGGKKQGATPTTFSVKVQCFLSKGLGEPVDPICVATFNMCSSTRTASGQNTVLQPRMFSHLGQDGCAVYQEIVGCELCAKFLDVAANAGVGLEYGPNLLSRRTDMGRDFRPAPLTEQAAHCDGNFYHAKGQWVRVVVDPGSQQGHGVYRVSPHDPLRTASDMETPSRIRSLLPVGPPHMNSMSFMMNVNGGTTLSFPPEDPSRNAENVVDDVPFGGLSAFSFFKEHLGSLYMLDPNERPHLYAHSGDLRQFPVATFSNLLVILAAKQRVERLRVILRPLSVDTPTCSSIDLQEQVTALKHFIFDILTTSTYKEDCQAELLKEVQAGWAGQAGSADHPQKRPRA
jgi:hypothetical protein